MTVLMWMFSGVMILTALAVLFWPEKKAKRRSSDEGEQDVRRAQ